jgi:DNA-binding NtrC family response regulator
MARGRCADFLLIDLEGIEVSAMLFLSRVLSLDANTRIVLLSNQSHVSMPGSVLSHPRVGFLKKPLDPERLQVEIRRLCRE